MRIGFMGDGFPDAQRTLAELLPGDEVGAADDLESVDVLVPAVRPVDGEVLDRLRPRLVQQFGAGVEGVDLDAARERGVAVANVPAGATGNAAGVAEIAVLHLLALARRLDRARTVVADGGLGEPMGYGLNGRMVALLGLGDIGREVAMRLRGFGVGLVGIGRREQAPAEVADLLDEYRRLQTLADALNGIDDLVVALPVTDETRGIVDEPALAALNGGGFVVNVGRGALVDYDALLTAMRSRQVGGAGLDVFWTEPFDPADPILRENVSATPHIGGLTRRAYHNTARGFADNVDRLRAGEEPANRIV